MVNAIRNSSTDYHQKFDTFIKDINDKCSKELNNIKGSGKFSIKKPIYKTIAHLCEKYNTSIYSIHSHNKRVVARAYQSFKKNNNYIGDALKINANDFNDKCLDFQFVKSLKGEELDKFCTVLQKDETLGKIFVAENCDELLKSENKAVFNALPMEAKMAFVEQNKADINFLSVFSNIYKDELAFDLDPMGSSNQELSEIQTAFKDAIIANKADIIKNPSLLAYADKDSILSIITNIKDDISLQKALIQSYTYVTKEIAEEALNANNRESENINQTTTDNFTKLLKGEITQEKFGSIESVQLLSDCNRGYTFEFSCGSGTVKLTEEDNKTADGEHFLSKQDILNTILEQSKEFSAEDKEALADFVTNCSVQGLFAGLIPGTNIFLKIEGDDRPFMRANKSSDGLHVNVIAKGTCSNIGGIPVQNEIWQLGDINVDKNEFELFYPKSILSCKGKSKEIKVLEINQKQNLPITENEKMEHNALRKIKNEDGSNGVLSTDEFGAFMKNSNIVNDNLKYLDENPAALKQIPKKILQEHIKIALNEKNEPLAKALEKAANYMNPTGEIKS